MKGRVLIIAGSDSGGGAGIQGDIKTVSALGGYAATAITALTAQNTQGVFGIHDVPTDFIRQQMVLVLDDIGADAIKTGMLHNADVIETVADTLKNYSAIPLVVDPVMIAKGGHTLLQDTAVNALIQKLLPIASLLTPNAPEAQALSGIAVKDRDSMLSAATALQNLGARAVLLKGGHLTGDTIHDLLLTPEGTHWYTHPRIQTPHTHGTGCTMASAIATGLAQGAALPQAVENARLYVLGAIKNAPGFGDGHGPLNHGWQQNE